MFYCERQPYYKNSKEYFLNNVNHYEILYNDWVLQNYRAVLLIKMGSYSDPEEHWALKTEKDRTMFMMRWG